MLCANNFHNLFLLLVWISLPWGTNTNTCLDSWHLLFFPTKYSEDFIREGTPSILISEWFVNFFVRLRTILLGKLFFKDLENGIRYNCILVFQVFWSLVLIRTFFYPAIHPKVIVSVLFSFSPFWNPVLWWRKFLSPSLFYMNYRF